jgi:hypothetical protein
MQRAINLDRARAITQSQNQFAQLGANYAAQIGGAGLAAQQQGAGIQASLGQAQMNALSQVNAGYPDASMYGHKPMMKMEQFFISPEIACKSMDCASTFTLLYASISIP